MFSRVIPATERVTVTGHGSKGRWRLRHVALQHELRSRIGCAFDFAAACLIKDQPCAFGSKNGKGNVTGDGDRRVVRVVIDGLIAAAGNHRLGSCAGRIVLDMPLRGIIGRPALEVMLIVNRITHIDGIGNLDRSRLICRILCRGSAYGDRRRVSGQISDRIVFKDRGVVGDGGILSNGGDRGHGLFTDIK